MSAVCSLIVDQFNQPDILRMLIYTYIHTYTYIYIYIYIYMGSVLLGGSRVFNVFEKDDDDDEWMSE